MSAQDINNELIALTVQLLAESGEPYKRNVRMDDTLQSHLRIDSLTRAELFQRIEKKFNANLPEKLLLEAETLQDIANYLQLVANMGAGSNKMADAQHHHAAVDVQHTRLSASIDVSRASSLTDIVLSYGEGAQDKPHIYFQHEDGQQEIVTYGNLLMNSLRVAAALRGRGLREGETVAIMQPTTPLFFYTFLGVQLAGGIPVPIYPPFRPNMLEAYAKTEAKILRSAQVRMLVTFEQAETLSRLLQGFVPSLRLVVTAHELLKERELNVPYKATADNFAFIQYTSGSTSDPKGVLLTHQNLLANIRGYGKALGVNSDDVTVSWLPLYHDMGLIGSWLGSLYHGVPLVLMTPFSFLMHPERWLWAIHNYRGTISGAPNFAYELCIRKIDYGQLEGLDLSSWRVAANGAEKVYPSTLQQFAQKFMPYGLKSTSLKPMYGLAESTVALTMPLMDSEFRVDHVDRKQFEENKLAVPVAEDNGLAFVDCGKPLEGHEIRIVDDEMNVLPARSVGRLQFRGPSSMQGYYNNPVATQAVYFDGWIDSGDLGYIVEGNLFIAGRRKDLIIKAGRNLYPVEIEELVGNVEGVRQGCVAVFSVADEQRNNEQLIIVAETRISDKSKRQAIIEGINDAVSQALDIVPDHVVLVAPHAVPKTSSGKLRRAACKTLYIQGRLGKWRMPAWMQVAKLALEMSWHKTIEILGLAARTLYTAYVALLVLVTSLPVIFMVLFASSRTAGRICKKWFRLLLFFMFCPLKISGEEQLPDEEARVIFAANHASYLDALVALIILPDNTHFIGKKELFSVPILRIFLRKLKCLPIDRMDYVKGLEDTQIIEQTLRAGDSVFIFPEGTFGYSSGLRPFRMGAFKLAAQTGTPICPLSLQGTRQILRESEFLLRPGRIKLVISPWVYPHGSEWQDVTDLRLAVRAEIAKHCGEPSLDYIAAQTVAVKPPPKGRDA